MAALAPPAATTMSLLSLLGAMLLAASVPSVTACLHTTSAAKEGFTPPIFSYTGESGPLNWHSLKAPNVSFAECAHGRNQSPINIVPGGKGIETVGVAQRPLLNYTKLERAELKNLGYTIEVHASGTLTFDGAPWALRQFHFHTPSEHRLQDEHFPVEAHFVHEPLGAPKDGPSPKLVLGLFLDFTSPSAGGGDGRDDGPLQKVLNKACDVAQPGSKTNVTEDLVFADIADHVKRHVVYQYNGSLTTPPCSEGVKWLVSGVPLPLSVGAYSSAKKVLRFNSRFTQNSPGEQNLIVVAAENLGKKSSNGTGSGKPEH